MKKLIIYIFFLTHLLATAQTKHGANWIFAFDIPASPNKIDAIQMNFDNNVLKITEINSPMIIDAASSTISDENGNLVAYTNSCYIANRAHQEMKNGDGIVPLLTPNHCKTGNDNRQSSLFLPLPQNPNLYCLFQLIEDKKFWSSSFPFAEKLNISILDFTKDNNLGEVVVKNQEVLKDSLSNFKLTAVRHSNGTDWWIVVNRSFSNGIYALLLTNKGISDKVYSTLGKSWHPHDWSGQAVFSPNGKKYARADPKNVLQILDFDRCTGRFFNPKHIQLPGYISLRHCVFS